MREIVSSDFPDVLNKPEGKSFLDLLNQTSKALATAWFQKFPAQTSLLPNIRLANDPTGQVFTLGLTQVKSEIWLFWTTSSPVISAPPTLSGALSKEGEEENALANNVWEQDTQQTDLLNELSRVNNELVNARRELIKQNIELHRMHQKLGKKN
ncbi:hypothetical protein [Rufibacter sp. DG15C]|uniref:hypothetical protein n=1 Tax=Rufibacter sp. DG15C TaxID=1379909 RepID=UPI001E458A2B|nr:hypothetical protein [Rufibacter sp. DG15C]